MKISGLKTTSGTLAIVPQRKKRERFARPPVYNPDPKRERKMLISASLKTLAATAAITAALALSACGTTPGDRAVSGGLIGAGAGAAIGSLSGNAGAGAVIGGVAGAATGALTDPCTLNLGDPWWRDHGGPDAYYARCGR